ncbi:carbamoyltransferase family protein [Oligoflexus tunisiensis]|uniref:carbamoyltransferase family protein n=1 Tax=Oligoflexus tunisiensis TaxID=708132 RepID=UPI000AACCC5B|nr:carbamoyltransferase C-terminal domain-containing protein [Oligoflexus tunisiensis]
MYTLGINAAFHDSSACLVKDGQVLAAAEEERFTRIKHGKRPIPFSTYELPFHAMHYCLEEAGIRLQDVEHVAYSYDPALQRNKTGLQDQSLVLPMEPSAHPKPEQWDSVWEGLFLSSILNAPRHLAGGFPHHLAKRFQGIRFDGPFQWHFVPHHLAHAASAFHPSPFVEAAVMTLDGRGEQATTNYGFGKDVSMEILGQVHMPHSLGMLYEEVTTYLGFLHSSDEYKVMALASFGKPRYLQEFRDIVQITGKGQYRLQPLRLVERLGPERRRGEEFSERHFDIAHSLQKVLEETVLELAHWLHQETRLPHLCMAGGVALNCVMNARIRDHGPFEDVWVQPAAGDAGTSLGAALWIDGKERRAQKRSYRMDHVYLGPAFDDEAIEEQLKRSKLSYRKSEHLAQDVADLLIADNIVGWFQGRMEFGPRALGSRSILASPLRAEMQARLNDIKDREDFRPVAPVVLEEEASAWFLNVHVSPFMLFVHDVRPEKAPLIPAVCHIDGTARVQTVNTQQNALYYELIQAFGQKTGVPVLINTSFNTKGQPIVCTPADAVACFYTSPLDVLVMGSFIVTKLRMASGETRGV